MSRFSAFLIGGLFVFGLGFGTQQALGQLAQTPDGKVQTVIEIPKGSLSIPAGGMGILSDDDYLYIFRPATNTVTRVSKTRVIDGKPETYRMTLP